MFYGVLQNIVETDLSKKELIVYFQNEEDIEAVRDTVRAVLQDSGDVTVHDNSVYTGLRDTEYPCKMRIQFSLHAQDLVLGYELTEEIEVRHQDVEAQYTDN